MKATDVKDRLGARLPALVDQFTTNIAVTSITSVGTTATVTTAAAHGRSVGNGVVITGAVTPVAIDTFTRVGVQGTITTLEDHDQTTTVPGEAIIEGATEAEFNGTFTVIRVVNRRTILVAMIDAGPTAATGTPLLTNGESVIGQYNGAHEITAVPSTTTFEYELGKTVYSPALGTIEARYDARVSTTITIDRMIDMYTEEPPNDYWLFVEVGDVLASKSRDVLSDAVDNTPRSGFLRQQLLQDVNLYLVVPTSDELTGAKARDVAEELFKPICQSVLMDKFDTLLTNEEPSPLQFVAHGFAVYTSAYYMHRYSFQQVAELQRGDSVGNASDVAFRNIDITISSDLGAGELVSEIDLDEEPLP